MIPRIIHYTWFSGDPFPEPVQQCIDSWHRLMPDWEFRLWDADSVNDIDSIWLHECLKERKWAFAADFVRCYAVYHYGGIYLDTDCLLYQSLEPFLSHPAFIGREWYVHIDCFTTQRYLTSHCFGAEAKHLYISHCLHYYDNRHFVRSSDSQLPASLRFDQTLLPLIQSRLAQLYYGYDPRPSSDGKQADVLNSKGTGSQLVIYPHSFFDCYTHYRRTVCRHLALGGWDSELPSLSAPSGFFARLRCSIRVRIRRIFWRMGYIITDLQ